MQANFNRYFMGEECCRHWASNPRPSDVDHLALGVSHPYCFFTSLPVCHGPTGCHYHLGDLAVAGSKSELPLNYPDCVHPAQIAGFYSSLTCLSYEAPLSPVLFIALLPDCGKLCTRSNFSILERNSFSSDDRSSRFKRNKNVFLLPEDSNLLLEKQKQSWNGTNCSRGDTSFSHSR